MCGIVGVGNFSASAIDYKDVDMFYQLLIANSARGMHGTGIIKVLTDGFSDWRKIQGHPFCLLDNKKVREEFLEPIRTKEWARWMVGHNRYATKGGVSTKSSHPFTHGAITLVHNGTCSWSSLEEMSKYDVDSEAICASIDKRGPEETIQKFSGPFALVWYNSSEQTLNMIRNYGRPMFVGTNFNSNRVIFCSEKEMGQWVAVRNSVNMEFAPLPEYQLVTFELDEIKPRMKKIEPYKSTYVSYTGYPHTQQHRYAGMGEDELEIMFGGACGLPDTTSKTATSELPPIDHGKVEGSGAKKSVPAVTTTTSVIVTAPKMTTGAVQGESPKSEGTKSVRRFTPLDMAYGIRKGEDIEFDMYDYKWVDTVEGRFLIMGGIEDIPNVEIRCTIRGEGATIDSLQEAYKLKGQVVSITRDDAPHRPDELPKYVIYVINLDPQYDVGYITKEQEFKTQPAQVLPFLPTQKAEEDAQRTLEEEHRHIQEVMDKIHQQGFRDLIPGE